MTKMYFESCSAIDIETLKERRALSNKDCKLNILNSIF
jgi:hypothetical protein